MVRSGKPGIMLDRIYSEHKLRNDGNYDPGGDGYFVRTTDGKRIGPMSGACASSPHAARVALRSPHRVVHPPPRGRARVQHRAADRRRAARGECVARERRRSLQGAAEGAGQVGLPARALVHGVQPLLRARHHRLLLLLHAPRLLASQHQAGAITSAPGAHAAACRLSCPGPPALARACSHASPRHANLWRR